ncbi:hypothetical protein LTR05_001428 [Lithohypha guttulata]|uniref:Uncharacterized protein n=1 Tax=Lithohypha guttulata TaxID=1690604 RepID=A0AAN7YF40_9EURO|nr:hypothetical protein LTR05_001428 [Lithohypha guttulata]
MAVQVGARFGYQSIALSQLIPLTRELMRAKLDEYAHSPQQLRDAAHQIEDIRDAFPLLLNVFHTSDHVTTKYLGMSAPPWAVAFGEAVFQGDYVGVVVEAEPDSSDKARF